MASVTDEPIDVAGLVAPTEARDPYWPRVYATLRAYRGLLPDDRVSRCRGCGNWCIHPDDHGGRDADSVPRPWASKRKGERPVCSQCVPLKASRRAVPVAVPGGFAL